MTGRDVRSGLKQRTAMPRYFFHIHGGASYIDEDGMELPDLPAARRMATKTAGAMLHDDPEQLWDGHPWRMVVTLGQGVICFVLRFSVEPAPVAV